MKSATRLEYDLDLRQRSYHLSSQRFSYLVRHVFLLLNVVLFEKVRHAYSTCE
jgi:hypothetical protein